MLAHSEILRGQWYGFQYRIDGFLITGIAVSNRPGTGVMEPGIFMNRKIYHFDKLSIITCPFCLFSLTEDWRFS